MEIGEISDLLGIEPTIRNLLSQAKDSLQIGMKELIPDYEL
jgi:hypothetical protein